MDNYFVTITGVSNYYDKKPFEIGRVIRLTKDYENEYDQDAIKAELPYIGTIGYVANSPKTVFKGTQSASKMYDKIGDYTYAYVMFITHSSVIALVVSPEHIEKADNQEYPVVKAQL